MCYVNTVAVLIYAAKAYLGTPIIKKIYCAYPLDIQIENVDTFYEELKEILLHQ